MNLISSLEVHAEHRFNHAAVRIPRAMHVHVPAHDFSFWEGHRSINVFQVNHQDNQRAVVSHGMIVLQLNSRFCERPENCTRR